MPARLKESVYFYICSGCANVVGCDQESVLFRVAMSLIILIFLPRFNNPSLSLQSLLLF